MQSVINTVLEAIETLKGLVSVVYAQNSFAFEFFAL